MSYNNNRIVLIGGGGHSRAIVDIIEQFTSYSISLQGRVEVAMVLEDSRVLKPSGWQVICSQYNNFVIAIGQIKTAQPRIDAVEQISQRGGQFPTIISPTAYVSPRAKIGRGTIVMHNAVVNAGAIVDEFCIINTGAILEHDTKVGDFCHISTGAVVNGGATVGSRSFVGSNAVVLNQIRIGNDVILGAGSIACTDIDKPGIYRGNPAGRIK